MIHFPKHHSEKNRGFIAFIAKEPFLLGVNLMDIYFDYHNKVLKNKTNITNAKELAVLEYKLTSIRTAEIILKGELNNNLSMLDYKNIHFHLFQDLYEWAGQYRKVNISKGETGFLPYQFFDNAEKTIDKQINDYLNCPGSEQEIVCEKLAKIMIDLNHMHPFREGNGRTQREFVRQLALIKGFHLNISPEDNLYMKASIEDNGKIMYQSLLKNIKGI